MDRTLRQVLAENLKSLQQASPDLHTRLALSKRTGLGQATLRRIELCEAGTSIDNLEVIAAAFGVTPYMLLHPNPPLARREAEFYARMRELADTPPK